jgi:hypothetical protein
VRRLDIACTRLGRKDSLISSPDACFPRDEEWQIDDSEEEDGDMIWHELELAFQDGSESMCTCCATERLHAQSKHARCLSKNLLVVPVDNLLLFLDNPGVVPTGGLHPDRRSMYRMMCGLVMSHVNGEMHVCKNPYLMFCSPVTERILRMFKTRYAPKGERGSTPSQGGIGTPHFPTLGSSESTSMIDDIVLCWWESVGMPSVLQHRGSACLVRRALRG